MSELNTEKERIENLLKPRYKVIAEWPDMLERFSVGYIFEHPYGRQYLTEQSKYDPADFPHLFKPLAWWEHREESEMPMYVKQTGMVDGADNPVPDWYLKVKKHFNAGNGEWRDNSINIFCAEKDERTIGIAMTYSGFEPANETEYNNYINSNHHAQNR